MTVETIEITDREQWLALRTTEVTASDVAAISGVDPRRSPLRVYLEKTGVHLGTEENAVMKKGRWFEPAIIRALADHYPTWEVREAKVYLRDSADRIGATPDFFADDPERKGLGIVQGKVVARPSFRDNWCNGGDEITAPIGYQLQTLTEAKLAGASWAVLAVLVHDSWSSDLHVLPVELHEAAWQKVRATVKQFWLNVEAGRMPPVTPSKDSDIVKALYPRPDGTTIDLSGDNLLPEMLAARETLKGNISADTKALLTIDTAIKGKMGEAEFATLADWSISLPLRERKAYTVAATSYRQLVIRRKAS